VGSHQRDKKKRVKNEMPPWEGKKIKHLKNKMGGRGANTSLKPNSPRFKFRKPVLL